MLKIACFGVLIVGCFSASAEPFGCPNGGDIGKVIFVVLSQSDVIHKTLAQKFEKGLCVQAKELGWPDPKVYLLHRDFHRVGDWTVFPILDRLFEKHRHDKRWAFICLEHTRVHLKNLAELLKRFDAGMDWFIGRALRDEDATIVHHFAFHKDPRSFSYPAFAAGFALSFPLLRKLVPRQQSYVEKLDFSIDAQHEFALFVWNDGEGVELVDVPEFCLEARDGCVTFRSSPDDSACGEPTSAGDVFFAVKSCKKFEDRVSVVLRTWASCDLNVKFFTDSANNSYPTVNLGIPNTERGHCSKTLGILDYVVHDDILSKKPWLVIADDDTLLSVPRLLQLLSCYDPSHPIALGERYGSRTASGYGYDYITGGGGMVFSAVAVRSLVESGVCTCPSDDSPDDMVLGICLNRLGIPVIHSSQFHQARPMDYPAELLDHPQPISFHKFWMIDPLEVYAKWLNVSGPLEEPPRDEL